MIVGPDSFEGLWNEAITADLADSEDKKLLVFVSTAEADSVCAIHILQVGYLANETASARPCITDCMSVRES